jgi:SNF2 family DNA or RNA helicase
MIKLIRGRLRWQEEDVVAMTKIIGPMAASRGQIAVIDSVLKAADSKGVQISGLLRKRLEKAFDERTETNAIRRLKDIEPHEYYPPAVTARMFGHQRVALQFMSPRRNAYLLADQPGVGKTPVAIAWAEQRMIHEHSIRLFDQRYSTPSNNPRALIIAPNSAKRQWAREIERWSSMDWPITIVDGTIKQQIEQVQRDGWIVAHWEALVNARAGILERAFDVSVLDEAHAIRNRDTKRAENAFLLQAPHRLALTGHPWVNSPDEFWSILHYLYPNQYTAYWTFFSMHVEATPKLFGDFEIEGARKPKLLRWELEPFALRRLKRKVWRSLPAILREPRYIDLPPKYRKEYKEIQKQFFAKLKSVSGERILAIPSVLARITRMRQYLVDPALLGGSLPSLKYPIVLEILEELDRPTVIFTSFKQAAKKLAAFLRENGRTVGLVHGDISTTDRDKVQRRFLAGKIDAAIIVTQAGGESLNYGKYGYVIFLDLPWSYSAMEQAEGRVDRPEEGTGRMVPTTAYRITVRDTFEAKEEAKIEKKRFMFDEVWSPDQLMDYFA